MDYGFIKLHRKMLDWEWYGDINTKVLFIHLLLKANWEQKQWQGIIIERGELISSIDHLSKETGLSSQNIRTSISRLKSTGELTSKSTNKYSLFKLLNYDTYQTDQQANQQTANKQLTTTKELKELKEEKKDIYRSFKHLTLTIKEFEKLNETYTKEAIDDILDRIENYKKNKDYISLYLSANNWLKKASGEKTAIKKYDFKSMSKNELVDLRIETKGNIQPELRKFNYVLNAEIEHIVRTREYFGY